MVSHTIDFDVLSDSAILKDEYACIAKLFILFSFI
jgi:hypothetical protein